MVCQVRKKLLPVRLVFLNWIKKLSITASDGAIISYPNGFDISSGETVQFIQPSTSARVLNQIYGENASQINGNLQSNGHVYLLNSAGIIFGENSVVEVGKLSAIAGSLSNSDFSNKIQNYTNLSGEIQNLGSIIAEEIVFAGSSISNTGTIIAENGMVILAAGGELSLQSEGSGLIVELSGNEQFITMEWLQMWPDKHSYNRVCWAWESGISWKRNYDLRKDSIQRFNPW